MDLQTLFILALVGLIIGYSGEGSTKDKSSPQRFCEAIKWISIIILALYILIIVAAFTEGLGDIPLIGGAVWVRGHWRRR
jgi:hypothetical protein